VLSNSCRTGEGVSARIHATNPQGDLAKEGHRSARRHSAILFGGRVESCMMIVPSIVLVGNIIRVAVVRACLVPEA